MEKKQSKELTLQEHKALVNQIRNKPKKDQKAEAITAVIENWCYRFYQFEKFTRIEITKDTPVAKVLAFEKMIKRDPQYKTPED